MIAVLLPKMTALPGLPGPLVALLMVVCFAALAMAFQDLQIGKLSRLTKALIVAVILAIMFSSNLWAIEVPNHCQMYDWWLYPQCWVAP